jgi:hypothetical protein
VGFGFGIVFACFLSSNSPEEEEEDAGEVHETENWDGPLLQMEQKFRPLARYLQSYLLTPVKHCTPHTEEHNRPTKVPIYKSS